MEPRYRGITQEEIPEVNIEDKIKVKIISGEFQGIKGPVQDVVTNPEYLDVFIDSNTEFIHSINSEYNVLAYIISGEAFFDDNYNQLISEKNLVIYRSGEKVHIKTKENQVRFLLISGKPLKEPVAWRGPIVMNTEEELQIAFREFEQGTFIKHSS
jgi:redox-sensitive bicupin YhaK (pirin superfamily)